MSDESNEDLLREGECTIPNCIEPSNHSGPHSSEDDEAMSADKAAESTTKYRRFRLEDNCIVAYDTRTEQDVEFGDPVSVTQALCRRIEALEAENERLRKAARMVAGFD